MAEEEKTEAATPKKLEKARGEGDVPKSQDVPILMMLLVTFFATVSPLGMRVLNMLSELGREAWGGELARPQTLDQLHALILYSGKEMALVALPFAVLFMLVSAASTWVQVGFLLTSKVFKFKLDSFNVFKGIKKMFGMDRVFKLFKSVIKLSVYVVIVYAVVQPEIATVMSLMGAQVVETVLEAGYLLKRVMIYILLVSVVFAAIDIVWVRYRHQKKMKMTKQEVRDEVKQRQGDPKVRAQIRKKQFALAGARMLDAVETADVVVTNPTHYAVAIQYNPPLVTTPRVVAKGRNKLALKIKAEARRLGVPIVENPPTAQLLYKLVEVDQEIPENLFQAVAEILAYVFRMDSRKRNDWKKAS